MKSFVEKILRGTHNHFSWMLPGRLSRLSSFVLKFLFSGTRLDAEQAAAFEHLPPNAVIVLISKHKSQLERLFFYTRSIGSALPCPEIGICFRALAFQPLMRLARIFLAHLHYYAHHFHFPDPLGSGYLQREIEQGRTGILPLVGADRCFRRSGNTSEDPLQFLLEMQRTARRPIYLVPYLFFYGNHHQAPDWQASSHLTGTDPKPSIWYRIFLLLTAPERVFVEKSEPLNLQEYIRQVNHVSQNVDKLALTLRHQLLDQITRHRQSITGPILKPIEEIQQQILTTERLQRFMTSWAQRRKMSKRKVQKEASKYIDEIAARPNPLVIRMAAWVVRRLLGHMFEGLSINVEGLRKIRKVSRKGP